MADKYMRQGTTGIDEVEATTSSAGAGDAGKIVGLDSGGKIDPSMMPSGVTPEVITVVASEALTAGNLVNLYNNAGTLNVRKADATNARKAHGFVLANVSSSANATVYTEGVITGLSSLTPGATYWLHTTAGGTTTTIPTGSGQIAQEVGFAKSDTELVFSAQVAVTRA